MYLPSLKKGKQLLALQLGSAQQVSYALEVCSLTVGRSIESWWQGGVSKC